MTLISPSAVVVGGRDAAEEEEAWGLLKELEDGDEGEIVVKVEVM